MSPNGQEVRELHDPLITKEEKTAEGKGDFEIIGDIPGGPGEGGRQSVTWTFFGFSNSVLYAFESKKSS